MQAEVTLHHSRGAEVVREGDRFTWHDGRSYEIAGFTGSRIYSPSGFGGTPIVLLRQVGGDPDPSFAESERPDGLIEWCGDSVGAGIWWDRDRRRRSALKPERSDG